MRSHLLEGKVAHRRSSPAHWAMEHDVFYFALDLSELDEVDTSLRLVSRNRRNVFGFRDADHWPEPAADLRATVLDHLRAEGEDPTGWRITLVTSLRILGYVFNPASFYLCRDAGGALRIVIVEVHNTHHERHLYTLRARSPGGPFVVWDGQGILRLAVHRHGRPVRGARVGRGGRAAGSPSTSARATRQCSPPASCSRAGCCRTGRCSGCSSATP